MRRIGFVLTLAVIGFSLLVFYEQASVSTRGGEDVPLYSVTRHDPYGLAALYELLRKRGTEVGILDEAAPAVSGKPAVLLQVVAAEAPARAFFENQQLINWMTEGNTVIQLSRAPTDLMSRFSLKATTRPAATSVGEVEKMEDRAVDPDAAPVQTVAATMLPPNRPRVMYLWSPMTLAERKDPNWTPLARVGGTGALVAGSYRVGRGKLILIGAPTPALNGLLDHDENLEILLELLGNGPVLIDEWSHGIARAPTIVGFLHEAGLLPLLLQMAFIALLYVWSTSGNASSSAAGVARRRSSVEQIHTLGYLYSRSLDPTAALDRVRAEVRRRLAESLHGAAGLSPRLKLEYDDLSERLGRVAGESEMAGLLSRSHQFTREVHRERHVAG